MLNKNTIQDLKYFGVNDYQARAYLALVTYGDLPASKVCDYTRIPISKVYDVMNKLKTKGLAEQWSSKPIMYKAINPSSAIGRIVEEKIETARQLKDRGNTLIKQLIPLRTSGETWSSRGRTQFLEKIVEILSRSKKHGFTLTSDFIRYPRLDHILKLAVKRGVKIKILGTTELSKDILVRALWYVNAGADVRILPMEVHPVFSISDNKESCLKVDSGSNFIWSNNPAMLKMLDAYFQNLWKKAAPIQRYLRAEQEHLLAEVS